MSEPSMGRTNSPPPNDPEDDNIREGLGSLNRWSQSTASTSLSPTFVGHQRQGSVPRPFASGNSVFHKKMMSLETNSQARLPYQASDHLVDNDSLSQDEFSQVNGRGKSETQVADWSDLNIGSKASANTANRPFFLPETFDQPSEDYSTPASYRPHSQNDKRRQGPSQKAMLSKALQKANTAVLLDNAANFEGAMEAYNDACQLLQLVMIRSNGGEEEKVKLQEIVSISAN